MLVGSGPGDPWWLVEIKLPKLLTAVTDGPTLHPSDRPKPNQLHLMTDLNSCNSLPSPAGSPLFIFMLSFSTNVNNIQFQESTLNLQVYFFHWHFIISKEYASCRLYSTLTQSQFWFGEGSLETRAQNSCYTLLCTTLALLSRDCNMEYIKFLL